MVGTLGTMKMGIETTKGLGPEASSAGSPTGLMAEPKAKRLNFRGAQLELIQGRVFKHKEQRIEISQRVFTTPNPGHTHP
jgi:hypothetical protein